jgi:thioredoxin-like negative regulator of GroEL
LREPGKRGLEGRPVESLRYDRRRLLTEANRARNRGRDRRAISLYRRILLEEPRNVEVALRVAPLLAARGETFEAWQLFRSAATEMRRERRYEACLGALRDACRFVPYEYDAWRMRAEIELKLDREETAYDTLLEGRRHFTRPQALAQAIALLTRARAIEPWDPDVALDLARLYTRTGQAEVALELLASLARHVSGRELRQVRALQLRTTLSFQHAWLWLQALLGERRRTSSRSTVSRVIAPESFEQSFAQPFGERCPSTVSEECLPLEHEVAV